MFKYRLAALFVIAPSLIAACGEKESTPPATTKPAASTPAPAAPAATPAAANKTEEDAKIAELMAALPAPYNAANYDKGRKQYATCRACHLLGEGDGHRVGPNLHGMFGRAAGELEDFKYSKALLEADFEWTPELLDQWLASPRKFLPKNRMTFAGISNQTQRENIIAYLLVETAK